MIAINLFLSFVIPTSLFMLGLLVYLNNPKSITNKLFFLVALTSAASALGSLASKATTSSEWVFFWIKVTMVFASMVTPLMAWFVVVFPKDKFNFNKLLLAGELILVSVLCFSAIFNLLYSGAEYVNGSVVVKTGSLILLFVVSQILHLIVIVYTLIRRLFHTYGREREGFRYLVFGFVSTMVLITIFNVLLIIIFKNTEFVSFGICSFLILEGSIFYAITRHRLMDIRLVVARTVSYSLLIGLSGILYALLFAAISSVLVGVNLGMRATLVSTILALLMAFSFQSIRHFLEKITDKILYRDHYDAKELLYDLTLIMASTLRLENLTHQILQELLRQAKITRGAFILMEDDHIYEVAHEGYSQAPEIDEVSVAKILKGNTALIFEELPEGPEKELMRTMGFTLVAPLVTEGEYLGLLALGEKLSGDIYSSEDIKVVEILVPEAAVAIQNAKAYEEIKRFNITLQQEVNLATRDLQFANEKLKELDKLKDDFVSIASHELRTPMTAIRSYAWMALHRSDVPLSKTLEKYVARILISTERLINLVNDMLNISRIESGRVEINPEVVDLISLVKDIVDEVYFSKAAEKKIQFFISEKSVPKVLADPEKLRQVFLNLVGNSLKFTPDGGKITFDFFSDGISVETSVIDSGVGISKEDLPKLFHKFSRLDNTYTAAATSGGTGLGLYISRNLVELMHGKIKAFSEGEGKGSTFTISLPVATPNVLKDIEKYRVRPLGEVKPLEPVAFS